MSPSRTGLSDPPPPRYTLARGRDGVSAPICTRAREWRVPRHSDNLGVASVSGGKSLSRAHRRSSPGVSPSVRMGCDGMPPDETNISALGTSAHQSRLSYIHSYSARGGAVTALGVVPLGTEAAGGHREISRKGK